MENVTIAFAASPRTVISRLGTPGTLRTFGGLTLASNVKRGEARKIIKRAARAGISASVVRS